MISIQKGTTSMVSLGDYRECKVILPLVVPLQGEKAALHLAREVERRASEISGGFTATDGMGVYKRKSETVMVLHIAVKDDEQRFELLKFAYWVKKTLDRECVCVRWDNGVVQFVGHPDDDVHHNWGVASTPCSGYHNTTTTGEVT